MKKHVKDLLWVFIINLLTIVLALAIGQSFIRNENIFLIFVIAVIIVLIETKNIWYGVISSAILIMSFNFFLTEPYYTFVVDDSNYIITFFIFFSVSLIVGTLVIKFQKQIEISNKNEKSIHTMYNFSKRFLNAHEAKEIYPIVIEYLSDYLHTDVYILDTDGLVYGAIIVDDYLKEACNYSIEKNIIVGKNEVKYNNLDYLIFPIKSKKYKFANIICNTLRNLNIDEINFINNIVNELIIILEREKVMNEQEVAKEKIATEKFKTTLLRSLSHDIKTPLTTIQSGSKFLLDSYNLIDDLGKQELIKEIYDESLSINEFVINLLNMSKLNETKEIVNPMVYSIDDIINEAKKHIGRLKSNKKIIINDIDDLIFINTNLDLIIQVIVNLVNNSIRHTKADTIITINIEYNNEFVTFNVIDNGGGIDNNIIDKIFDDFYSLRKKGDNIRSTGLGLSICRAIVLAHHGEIKCYNNDIGGATFTFSIPRYIVKEAKL